MAKAKQELAQPEEWLIRLATEEGGYARLVEESGGMARAAYRLASARCKVEAGGTPPTLGDLQAAARLLATRIGRGGTLPITSLLVTDSNVATVRATQAAVETALRTLQPPAPTAPRRERARAERSRARQSRPSAPQI